MFSPIGIALAVYQHNLAIMGDGGPLGLAPPSSKPTVQEGGQRTHKMTCAVYQQILALFISKSSPLLCSKLSQKVIIDDQWSL